MTSIFKYFLRFLKCKSAFWSNHCKFRVTVLLKGESLSLCFTAFKMFPSRIVLDLAPSIYTEWCRHRHVSLWARCGLEWIVLFIFFNTVYRPKSSTLISSYQTTFFHTFVINFFSTFNNAFPKSTDLWGIYLYCTGISESALLH